MLGFLPPESGDHGFPGHQATSMDGNNGGEMHAWNGWRDGKLETSEEPASMAMPASVSTDEGPPLSLRNNVCHRQGKKE